MSRVTEDGEVRFPAGFGLGDIVRWGTTGLVVLDESSNTVIKVPFDHGCERNQLCFQREREIYERFVQHGGHVGLLTYHGAIESGIRLEYASNHNLRLNVRKDDVGHDQRLQWAVQVADAIGFIHEAGVIHGDLTCANIFVDAALKARVADFAGSSIDGSPLLVLVIESHEFPGPLLSTQADLFALGSVLYEIMTGQPPYKGLDDEEIRDLYLKGKFPEISTLGAVGFIIEECWQTSYSGAEAVAEGLRGIPPTSAVESLDKNAGDTPGKSP